jgi:hypothetical protein
MSRPAGTGNNGKLQATVLKKCDRTYHRPETNKQCADGTCQRTLASLRRSSGAGTRGPSGTP